LETSDPAFYIAYGENKERPEISWFNGKLGLLDKNGKEVIPCAYESKKDETGITYHSSFYSEGLINVQKDGKYGYLNNANKIVIPFEFTNAKSFSNGKAEVTRNGKIEYIDKSGKTIPANLLEDVTVLPPIRK
jgi:hypothetical protein